MAGFIIVGLVVLIVLIKGLRKCRFFLRLLALVVVLAALASYFNQQPHLGTYHQSRSYLQVRYDVFICPDGLDKHEGNSESVVVCSRPDGSEALAYDLRTGERLPYHVR